MTQKEKDKYLDGIEWVPLVHAHWAKQDDYVWDCSNCHALVYRDDYDYCPWCGAKMTEGEEDD